MCVCVCEREREGLTEQEPPSPSHHTNISHTYFPLYHQLYTQTGCLSTKTGMTGRQNQFETGLTGSLFHNPTVELSCLLNLLAHDLCRLVIRRAEVIVKEPLSVPSLSPSLEYQTVGLLSLATENRRSPSRLYLCVCVCVCVCVLEM